MKQLLFVAAIAATFTACQVKYEKTKSGLLYKITKGKGGEKLKAGEYVKFHVTFSLPEKNDTVLKTTVGSIPGYVMVDTSARAAFSFMEVLPLCAVGDSLTFNMSIDTLKKLGAIPEYNNIYTKGGMIQGRLKVINRFKTEQETTEDYKKETELVKVAEIKSVEDYLAKKGIKAQKTKSGAFVVVEVAGDQALKADSGKQASVMYKGSLQATGKVFDTNMDTSMHHTEPFKLVVGTGQVIRGWDEALPYFGKGGKGKVYIPSSLGYGPQPMGTIPPNSNLVFEVEILDVTTPPPPAPAPAMPPVPGGQMPPQHGGGH